jgi:WD40 repeat protein
LTGSPPITAIAIDETERIAIVGSQAGLVVHEWPDLSFLKRVPTRLENIHDISIAPDRSLLAVAGGSPHESGIVELYRWPLGELWKSIGEHSDLVHAVSWREDSRMFATASADKSIRLFDRETAACLQVLEGHSGPVLAAEFLPDKLGLVTASVDESLRFWDEPSLTAKPAVPRPALTNHTRQVYDLAIQPLGGDSPPIVASVGEDNTVRLWQPTIGRMMRFAKFESAPLAVCWSADGEKILASCKDGSVCAIDPKTVAITAKLKVLSGPAYSIASSSSGSVLVGGANGSLHRLDGIDAPRR